MNLFTFNTIFDGGGGGGILGVVTLTTTFVLIYWFRWWWWWDIMHVLVFINVSNNKKTSFDRCKNTQ